MADIAAGNVTTTLTFQQLFGRKKQVIASLAFGNSTLTYPSGGVPITGLGYLGFLTSVDFAHINGPASDGYIYKWDNTNRKIRIYRGSMGGIYTYSPGGGDIKGATSPAGTEGAADQAAAPVNSALLVTAALWSVTPWVIAAQPDIARNLMITVINDSGGPLDLYEGTTTYAIVGTFRGAAQTENLTWVSTGGNKSVA